MHYGVKANNCSACGKGYRTKNELLRHQTKTCLYREMIRSQEESGQTDDDFNLDFDESLLIWSWITINYVDWDEYRAVIRFYQKLPTWS